MAERIQNNKIFKDVWERALRDYQAMVPKDEWNVDLHDEKWLQIRNVDDMLHNLTMYHDDFEKDTGRDSSSSGALKATLNGVGVLIGMFGGAAGAAFPPCSQVLGAVTVLIEAGKRVSGAFDAVDALFERLSHFMTRLKPLSTHGMDPLLVDIAVNLLICTLRICGVATRKSCHDDKVETITKDGKRMHWWHRSKQVVTSRGKEFFIQLAKGSDPEIEDLIAQVKDLVDAEGRMTAALTNQVVGEINDVSFEIRDLNKQIASVTFEMNEEVHDIKIGVLRSEAKMDSNFAELDSLAASSIAANKAAHAQEMSRLDVMEARILERIEQKDGVAMQNSAIKQSSSETTCEQSPLKALETALEVRKSVEANSATYERITEERMSKSDAWILRDQFFQEWAAGNTGCLLVSGNSGFGKTFLASYVVQELLNRHKQNGQGMTNSVAFYFFQKGQAKLGSTNDMLRTLAYTVAANDPLYASYLQSLLDNGCLKRESGQFIVARMNGNAVDVGNQDLNAARSLSADEVASSNTLPIGHIYSVPGKRVSDQEVRDSTHTTSGTCSAENERLRAKMSRVLECLKMDPTPDNEEDDTTTVQAINSLWQRLFHDYYRKKRTPSYIVIDAVDDYSEMEAMALWAAINGVGYLASNTRDLNLHILLFVRSTTAEVFLETFSDRSTPHIHIDSAHNHADMLQFVEGRMAEAWKGTLVSSTTFDLAKNAIVKDCHGSFLKASLVVDEITSLSRESLIRDKLNDLPPSINAAALLAVTRLERQLDNEEVEDLHDILSWITCARRDISLAELDGLLQIRHPLGARVIDLEKRLKKRYMSLFSVREPGSNINDRTRRLRLVGVPVEQHVHNSSNSIPFELNATYPFGNTARGVQRTMKDTYISLGHVLIKEQMQSRTSAIGLTDITTDIMQARVLLNCLNCLCETHSNQSNDTIDIVCGYCAVYLPEHILAVSPTSTTISMRLNITRRLLQILREPECIDRWVRYASTFLADDLLGAERFSRHILDWLTDPDTQINLKDDERDWIATVSKEPVKLLFSEIARGCFRKWLQSICNGDDLFRFLRMYLHKIDVNPTLPNVTGTNITLGSRIYPDFTVAKATVENILFVARTAGFEENALWNARVAATLRSAKHYDESIEFYTRASTLDPNNSFYRGGLAVTYAQMNRVANAASKMAEAVELGAGAIEKDSKSLFLDYSLKEAQLWDRHDLALYYLQLGSTESAFLTYEAALEDWEAFDPSYDAHWRLLNLTATDYFRALCDTSKWHLASAFIERLANHPQCSSESFSTLHHFMLHQSPRVLRIGYETKRFDVVEHLSRRAIANIARFGADGQAARIRHAWGVAMLRLTPDRQDNAIALLVSAAEDEEVQEASNEHSWVKTDAQRELARTYLCNALEAREKDMWQEVGEFAGSLVDLSTSHKTADGQVNYGTRATSLILAAWYLFNRRMSLARDCVTTVIRLGLEMLLDDDLENDSRAWKYLADALLVVGDESRAIAAANMLRRALVDNLVGYQDPTTSEQIEESAISYSRSQTSKIDHEETIKDGPAVPTISESYDGDMTTTDDSRASYKIYPCDGPCFSLIPNDARFYRCSYCLADFCERCQALLKTGEMSGWSVCGASHHHVEIPGILGMLKAEHMKTVTGEQVRVSTWVRELERDWGLLKNGINARERSTNIMAGPLPRTFTI